MGIIDGIADIQQLLARQKALCDIEHLAVWDVHAGITKDFVCNLFRRTVLKGFLQLLRHTGTAFDCVFHSRSLNGKCCLYGEIMTRCIRQLEIADARRLRQNLVHCFTADLVKQQTSHPFIPHFMQIVHDKAAQISLRPLDAQTFRLIQHNLDIILRKAFPRRTQVVFDGREPDIHLIGKRHLRNGCILQQALQKATDDIVLLLTCTRQTDGFSLSVHDAQQIFRSLLSLQFIAAIGRSENLTLLICEHLLQRFDI